MPRFEGKYPSNAGVFYFHCNNTDRRYYGHTSQKDGIGGRIRSMIAALNKGKSANTELQKDWSAYGESAFDICVFVYGDDYANVQARVQVFNTLIYKRYSSHPKGLLSLYNTQYLGLNDARYPIEKGITNVLIGPLPQQQVYEPIRLDNSGLVIQPPLGQFSKEKPIYLADRKPVLYEGNIYLSIKEAATCFGVNWNVVNEKVKGANPDSRYATEQEIQEELVRRGWSTDTAKAVDRKNDSSIVKTTKGISKTIVVERKLFNTIAEAARFYGKTPNAVRKWPETKFKNSFFPIRRHYPNGLHPDPSWNPPKP